MYKWILIFVILPAIALGQIEKPNAGGGEANVLSDSGTYNGTEGFGLAAGKTGLALKVKGLIEGSNITITTSSDSGLVITAAGGSGVWTERSDTLFAVDADGDTVAVFWDDDAGNVRWQVATEDQTLRALIDSLFSAFIVGGTATTSDLNLQTTTAVGEAGADMHFLVGNDGATEAMTILNSGNVGIGINSPSSVLHIKADVPGTVGSHPAGQLIIQNPINSVFGCAVITGYESDAAGNPDQQLWYLGSSSSSNSNIIFLNRRNSKLELGTNGTARLTIDGDGNVGIGTTSPSERLSVVGNIATGDTAAGDVDVFHYFSTNGSWVTEYLKWDDGVGRFEISDDFDIAGNLTLSGTATIPNLIVTTDVNIADNAVKDSSIANNITIDHAAETDSAGKALFTQQDADGDTIDVSAYQPLEATLTDIADGIIDENLDNTINPWAANEIVSTVIHNDEIDASSELLAIMDDETGTGVLVFGTSPTFTTGITVPDNSISDEELDEGASFTWTAVHDFGGATSLEIPAVDNPTTNAEGEIAWDTNDDALEVYSGDEGESGLIPFYRTITATIVLPDSVQTYAPDICIFHADALIYPFGIEIDQVSITLSEDAAYEMVWEVWTAADPPAYESTISTLATGGSDSYAEEAPDDDEVVEADKRIYLDLPTTDVAFVMVNIIYHVTPGN